MPLAIREQLLSAIETRLATIPGLALVGRAIPVGDKYPALVVWDRSEQSEPRGLTTKTAIALTVEYVAAHGAANPSTFANALLAEVVQTLTGTDPYFGGLADSCRYSGASIEYPDSQAGLTGIRAAFTVEYVTQTGDPFAQ